MQSLPADLVIKSLEGNLIAVVEVKNLKDLSREEAIEMRRLLLNYGFPSDVPYFLLLSQEVGFLWKEAKPNDFDAAPTYEFPMDKVVIRYSEGKPAARRLYGAELELLVLQWLTNLATKPQRPIEEPETTLAHAGFNDSIKGASVFFGEAA